MGQRIEQLDSLRGLAALTVAADHFAIAFLRLPAPGWGVWSLVYWSPLHCVLAGGQAVLFFFVLSGFVLSLPFYRRPVPYGPWIVKRCCRIYLPYYGSICLALLLIAACQPKPIPSLTPWFNHTFQGSVTPSVIVQHLVLIDSFHNGQLNPVVWSLVVEMRISLLFPLLILLIVKLNWRVALVAAYAIAAAVAVTEFLLKHTMHWSNDYCLTFIFVPQFVVGCLLARHQETVVAWYRSLRRPAKWVGLATAMLLYTYQYWCFPRLRLFHLAYADEQFTTLGVAVFIVAALGSSRAASLLLLRPLVALGKASYSLYLVHAVCLLAAIHLFFGTLPTWSILSIAGATTLGLTTLSYFTVEVPSIWLGRRLADRFAARRLALANAPPAVLQDGGREQA